jgi:hypothetical protein
MSFKLGLVGLCTSHPENWVPIIRKLTEEKVVDVEVVAAWDSGETRPADFAREFCKKFNIPKSVDKLEDMLDQVDGVIVHTTNWDKHLEQARPFVDAGKSVLLDKPMVGNLRDANQVLDWAKQKKRVTGGSSLRFAFEVQEFLKQPESERGEIYHAYAGCGTDDFNYGIHAYALLSGLLGPGVKSVQYIGSSMQKHLKVNWSDGKIGLLTVGKSVWLPFHITAVTTKKVAQITTDNSKIYRSLLEAELPYLAGKVETPPMSMEELLEPELTSMAARISWLNGGGEVFLTDLRQDDPGYDGTQFAQEYRRARMG